MNLSWARVMTVARREFLTTVRRKAFLFTLIGTPAYFGFVLWISASAEGKEREQALQSLQAVGIVDSSGLFANATREILLDAPLATTVPSPASASGAAFRPPSPGARRKASPDVKSARTAVRFYPDEGSAEKALRSGEVTQFLLIPRDYLETGRLERYAARSGLFSSGERAISGWMARNLMRGRIDSMLAARVAHPIGDEKLFSLGKDGVFRHRGEENEMIDFMLPFAFSMLLGISIILGGQYLLQGVAEEKESRILESLLCTLSSDELMTGKLLGLGAVGLAIVAVWAAAGALLAVPALAMLQVSIPLDWVAIAIAYFLLGYLFFGSLMTGIGAVTNNMREAQQFAVWFTFANFLPFIMMLSILSRPSSPLAVGLSMFPPTAATAMMMRLTAPSSVVPAWQIALSHGLLGFAAWATLRAVARIFRVGLLLYGKTPNLPEILRWIRHA